MSRLNDEGGICPFARAAQSHKIPTGFGVPRIRRHDADLDAHLGAFPEHAKRGRNNFRGIYTSELHAKRPVDTGHEMCGGEKFYSVLLELPPHTPCHLISSRFVKTDLMGNAHDIQPATDEFHCGSPTAGCHDKFPDVQIPRTRNSHFNDAIGSIIYTQVIIHRGSIPFIQ
jgi:hypothetical protein